MINFLFILLTFFIIQSAFMVILSINPIYSIFNLILVFIGSTILLLFCGIDFIAMLFLVVYVGAIAVLFLFVIMMLNLKIVNIKKYYTYYIIIGFFIGLIFLLEILSILIPIPFIHILFHIPVTIDPTLIYNNINETIISLNNIKTISLILYTEYIYLFILASLILLIAMIGAIVLTLQKKKKDKSQDYYKQTNQNIILKLIS